MIGWVTKRAVFEHLHKRIIQTANNNCGYVADAGVIISDLADRLQVWLNEMDIVDAVPVVHGKWIIRDNPGTGWYRVTCSECGEDVTATAPCIGFFPNAKVIWNYCPECGADMRGEQDE